MCIYNIEYIFLIMNKHEIIVFSKNRSQNESSSQFSVNLNNNIICGPDEYFTISLSSFFMIKSFYSIQSGLNNVFYIVMRKPNDTTEYFRGIPDGNYDTRELLKKLIELCFGLMDVSYDPIKNKFIFKRVENEVTEGYDVFIRPLNCGVILGLNDGIEKLVTEGGIYSDRFVNLSGDSSMLIKLGDVSFEKSYINMVSENFEVNNILGIIDIASVAPMDSITSDCKDVEYKISDKNIKKLSISIVNENNVVFPYMSDSIMKLTIKKYKAKSNEIEALMNQILTRINDMVYYVANIVNLITNFIEQVSGEQPYTSSY